MLDEVVYLQEQVAAGKLEHEIFDYMRYLLQHYEWLNFLFALGSGLEELRRRTPFSSTPVCTRRSLFWTVARPMLS